MDIYFNKIEYDTKCGEGRFVCTDPNLTIQCWVPTHGDRIGHNCVMPNPREGSGGLFLFVKTSDLPKVINERDGYLELETEGYQLMSFSDGRWAPLHPLGFHVENWQQFSVRCGNVEIHSRPRGVVDRRHIANYALGRVSLADLILLDWRLRAQPKLQEALGKTFRLKDSLGQKFHSSSAAEIQRLLTEVLQGS